jgi:hypothetical protein
VAKTRGTKSSSKASAAASSSDEEQTTETPEAQGEQAAEKHSRTEAASPASKAGVRTHHGFYARMGLGIGALIGNWTPDSSSTRHLVGFAEHYELALGGTPIPGLVIGGGIFGVIAGSPMYGWTTLNTHFNIPGGSVVSEIIGPFVDVYPKPTRGFHFMAALGPAGISQSSGGAEKLCVLNAGCQTVGTPGTPYSGVGVGFVAGVGYDVFVADHWSIGGMLRIMYTYANLSPNDSSFLDATLSSFTPALMFGATFQ